MKPSRMNLASDCRTGAGVTSKGCDYYQAKNSVEKLNNCGTCRSYDMRKAKCSKEHKLKLGVKKK